MADRDPLLQAIEDEFDGWQAFRHAGLWYARKRKTKIIVRAPNPLTLRERIRADLASRERKGSSS